METQYAAAIVKQKIDELKHVTKKTIFDEWVMVRIQYARWKVLLYQTPRQEDLKKNFKEDVSSLKPLDPSHTQIGEFAFSDRGHGTKFDAYLHAGENIFFLFNNTTKTTSEITEDPSWETAQTEFEKLLQEFIMDPVE